MLASQNKSKRGVNNLFSLCNLSYSLISSGLFLISEKHLQCFSYYIYIFVYAAKKCVMGNPRIWTGSHAGYYN